MDFQVTAQRGEFRTVECSGTKELDAALDALNMSVRDNVCTSGALIEEVLGTVVHPVSVGWSGRIGWVYVGQVKK